MAVVLNPTRYAVKYCGKRIGVVIPRNKSEWVFIYTDCPKFEYFIGDSPESAVAHCPRVQEYLLES